MVSAIRGRLGGAVSAGKNAQVAGHHELAGERRAGGVGRAQDRGEEVRRRGYRMHAPVGYFSSLPKPAGISDLLYQVQRFHSFIWASGGNYSDFYIHIIDHLGWMKNAWPVKAQALGGRHYRQSPEGVTYVDQNFDTYAVEYTYPDGVKLFYDGRNMAGVPRGTVKRSSYLGNLELLESEPKLALRVSRNATEADLAKLEATIADVEQGTHWSKQLEAKKAKAAKVKK